MAESQATRLLDANDSLPSRTSSAISVSTSLGQSASSPGPNASPSTASFEGASYTRINEEIFRISLNYRALHLNREQIKSLQSLLTGCDGMDSLDYIDGSCVSP